MPPNLAMIVERHRHYWHSRTLSYATFLGEWWERDATPGFWVEHLNAFEEAHDLQRHGIPLSRVPRRSTFRRLQAVGEGAGEEED